MSECNWLKMSQKNTACFPETRILIILEIISLNKQSSLKVNRKMVRSMVPRKLLMEAAHNKDELKYNELFDNAVKIQESLAREQHFIRRITGVKRKASKKSSWEPSHRNLNIITKTNNFKNNGSFNPGLQVSVLNNKVSSPGLPVCSTPDLSRQKRLASHFTFITVGNGDKGLDLSKINSSKIDMRKLTDIKENLK